MLTRSRSAQENGTYGYSCQKAKNKGGLNNGNFGRSMRKIILDAFFNDHTTHSSFIDAIVD